MQSIKLMSDNLANKIAAGEIIQRPLSIVKELVENAIDANSTIIEVNLGNAGIEKIIVIDNGIGISKMDLPLSIIRHATSKLYSEKELFQIGTLGFRGEALASMSSISQFSITSSKDGVEGYVLTTNESDQPIIEKASANKGTKVIVNNLFYNTPARYKHLSSPYYELSLIINYLNKCALSNSSISFKLVNDDKTIFFTTGNGDMGNVFKSVYNLEIANHINLVTTKNHDFDISIHMCDPQITKANKTYITTSINGRIVRNYDVENAVIDGYKNFLHINQYPVVFITINLDYQLVDVNVHPNKQFVKISKVKDLKQLITNAVALELSKKLYVPEVEFDKPHNPMTLDDNLTIDYLDTPKFNQPEIALTPSFYEENNQQNKEWQLPHFDYVGTLHATYLLFENKKGLYLVDQHAAQERINFEKFNSMFETKQFTYQQLLVPLVIQLTHEEYIMIDGKLNDLNQFGIIAEEFGLNTIKVTEIDNFYMRSKNLEADITNILSLLVTNNKTTFASYFEAVAIMMACKSSIKANQYINRDEINDLLTQLNNCLHPYTCPHGRPIIINVTTNEIEKLFKRVL